VPVPVPLDPFAIDSHGVVVDALQLHDAAEAVTVTVAVPASAPRFAVVGAIVNVHGGGGVADCVIVNVRPPIVSVPDRSAPPLAATVKLIVASPLPLVVFSVSHGTLLAAVHAQPARAAPTRTVPLPPAAPKFCDEAVTMNVHGSASCVMVNVCPAIVSVPVRWAPGFVDAKNATAPLPTPDAPEVTVIQFAFDVAVHAQPLPADMATLPVDTPKPTKVDVEASVNAPIGDRAGERVAGPACGIPAREHVDVAVQHEVPARPGEAGGSHEVGHRLLRRDAAIGQPAAVEEVGDERGARARVARRVRRVDARERLEKAHDPVAVGVDPLQ